MSQWIIGFLIGYYVIPDIYKYLKKRKKEKDW